jgi:aminoglycoside 6'-N-acetyltransferase I
MERITIRAAREADAEAWRLLRVALWPPDDHREEVAAFLRGELEEPRIVLLAKIQDGTLVGFAELSIREEVPGAYSDRVGYVEGLYVVPPKRGRGIARQLLAASRKWARSEGCGAFASDRGERFVVDRRFRGRT